MEAKTISIHALNALTILPRVALLLSRRRVPIRRLEMLEADAEGYANMRLVVVCDTDTGDKLVKQMARIVEVVTANVAHGDAFDTVAQMEPNLDQPVALAGVG